MSVEVELIKTTEEARKLSPLVSRKVSEKELTGFGGTTLEVRPDQIAVQINSKGETRALNVGRHRVRGLLSRRIPTIGLISQNALTLSAHVANVLGGGASGELLDGDIRYGIEIADAGQFFGKAGNAHAELRALDLSRLLESRVQAVLAPLLKQYAVMDLVNSGPAARKLLDEFRAALTASLAEFGLSLKWVHVPVLYRAQDSLLQAQKAMEMRQKLRQIELDDKMDALQKQAELEDFKRQLDVEMPLLAQGQNVGAALDERVSSLMNHIVGAIEDRTGTRGYFERLVDGSGGAASAASPAELSRADSLLRQQVSHELNRVQSAVRDARSHAHKNDNITLALRLKGLERRIETLEDDLANVQAAYLSGAKLSVSELQRALANDDALLARAQAIADAAQQALNGVLANHSVESHWVELETALASFRHQFTSRSRVGNY